MCRWKRMLQIRNSKSEIRNEEFLLYAIGVSSQSLGLPESLLPWVEEK